MTREPAKGLVDLVENICSAFALVVLHFRSLDNGFAFPFAFALALAGFRSFERFFLSFELALTGFRRFFLSFENDFVFSLSFAL
jgi:hypothetical protein